MVTALNSLVSAGDSGKTSSVMIALDAGKIKEYAKRTAPEWDAHIKQELVKFNTESEDGKQVRNNYLSSQTRYLIKVIQDLDAHNEAESSMKSQELRNLVFTTNVGLIQKFKNPYLQSAREKHKLSESDIDELNSQFDMKAFKVIGSGISRYDNVRSQPGTYLGGSLEKSFRGVWTEFFKARIINSAASLDSSVSGDGARALGSLLVDKKGHDPVATAKTQDSVNLVREAIEAMPGKWSSKSTFPVSPRDLIRVIHGIGRSSKSPEDLAQLLGESHGVAKGRTRQYIGSAERMLKRVLEEMKGLDV